MTAFLLIANKDGSGSKRRQRGFVTKKDALDALQHWKAEGYTTWQLFGTPRLGKPRPLLMQGAAVGL